MNLKTLPARRLGLTLAAATLTLSATSVPAASAATLAIAPASTASAVVPLAAHWGTFVKSMRWTHAKSLAQSALASNGFTEWGHPGNMVIGWNGRAVVQVSFSPQSNFTRVAYSVTGVSSSDSSAAELARNNVRATIVKSVFFDE
ncbi:hypothetical protein [Sphaerisporangium corydalis]|uniref:Uncharacterized protein n=1 Tax=Sphaerisporangium corydalis TaxID=1441875 RepID=A0ABV9E8W7_9ACTN|nr:hypothetical protein [Sphaerisporangium corydalis]